MKLSETQEAIKNSMLRFITEDTAQVMVYSGIAGCGKSTILVSMFKDYKEITKSSTKLNYYDNEKLLFTATTNVASENLVSQGVPSQTIYKELGLRIVQDWKSKTAELVGGRDIGSINNTTIVVDEYSFIDEDLKSYLNFFLREFTNKLILVGDSEQFLNISSETDLTVQFSNPRLVESEETFRFKEPVFSDYIRILKQHVKDRVIHRIPPRVGNTLFVCSDEIFVSNLRHSFREGKDCTVIAFTNNTVAKYNKNIRKVLGLSNDPKTITHLQLKNPVIRYAGCTKIGGKNLTSVELTNIKGSLSIILDNANINHSVFLTVYKKFLYLVEDMAPVKRLITKLRKDKKWDYVKKLTERVTLLNYGYAMTAHSSQGLSVDEVFLDLTDLPKLGYVLERNTIARLIYVAISRAKSKIYIRGQIPYELTGSYVSYTK
jgi:thymidine kinase